MTQRNPKPLREINWSIYSFGGLLLLAMLLVSGRRAEGGYPADFRVFHAAGRLFRDGRPNEAYDFGLFHDFLVSDYAQPADVPHAAHFLNPPPFGTVSQLLTVLPLGPSFGVYTVISVVVLLGCYFKLGLPTRGLPLYLVSPMVVGSLLLGQTGAFVLAVSVAVHTLLIQDRKISAGLAAGLFLLKPPLAFGLGLWWLYQARTYWKSLVASAFSGVLLTIATGTATREVWLTFFDTLNVRADADTNITAVSFSFAEFIKNYIIGADLAVTLVVWAIGIVVSFGILRYMHQAHNGDVAVMAATAAFLTVVFSPHVLFYDGTLLIIPVAVAFQKGALTSNRVAGLAGLIFLGQFGQILISVLLPGPGLRCEFLAALVAGWLCHKWIKQAADLDGEAGTPTTALAAAEVVAAT